MSEVMKAAEKRLSKDPYDVEAWEIIVTCIQHVKIEEARIYYEKLVQQFPFSQRYWILYIKHEVKLGNFDEVDKLFVRCIFKILDIDLWMCYVDYVKTYKHNTAQFSLTMIKGYNFVLNYVGKDFASYPIWSGCIAFLKNIEDNYFCRREKKIDAIREKYWQALAMPMVKIEQLWNEYIEFEKDINPLTADIMILDKVDDYEKAKQVTQDYVVLTAGLDKKAHSTPPRGHSEELQQVELWKKYIAWEKSNPLNFEGQLNVIDRVCFAYSQCLLCLGHYPDIWIEAALFLEQYGEVLKNGDVDVGKYCTIIYENALNFLKESMVIYFAYADFKIRRMEFDDAYEIYNKFIELPDVNPTLAYIQQMKFACCAKGIKSARVVFKKARRDPRCSYHVYVASALMEFHCSKSKDIAVKIFNLGLEKYGDNFDYLLHYLDYLCQQNDEDLTRNLFQHMMSLQNLTPEKSMEICNRSLEFEMNVGNLSNVLIAERKRMDAMEKLKGASIQKFLFPVDLYKFKDLYPCSVSERQHHSYSDHNNASSQVTPTTPEQNSLNPQAQGNGLPMESPGILGLHGPEEPD